VYIYQLINTLKGRIVANQKWQYYFLGLAVSAKIWNDTSQDEVNSIVNSFAELGNQGWEYVGDTSISKTDLTSTWSFAVFKKPI
jgi:hypothetical protein